MSNRAMDAPNTSQTNTRPLNPPAKNSSAKWLRLLVLDAALWYCLPIAFLSIYIGSFSQPSSSILAHLRVMALPFFGVQILRLALARYVSHPTLIRFGMSVLVASLVVSLMLYYLLVALSLSSWGGVISLDLIPTLFGQAPLAADELHLPVAVVNCIPAVVLVGVTAVLWRYFKRFDWTPAWLEQISTRATVLTLLAGIAAVLISAIEFWHGTAFADAEPLSLTLFSATHVWQLEGYAVNPVRAAGMDHPVELARKAYVPSTSNDKKNLIVVIVDALRPDHMSLYGYPRQTTPNLDRTAREIPTRIVTGTHASCGDTVCSMFSLFSSSFPADYAAHPLFLHEVLRRNGYGIHQLLSGDHLFFFSLKSYYGEVDSFYDGNQVPRSSMNDDRELINQLARMPDCNGKPVMIQFHLMSVHLLHTLADGHGPFVPTENYALHHNYDIGPGGTPPVAAVNLYDNGVLQADGIIQSLLQTLQSKGYLRNSLVVITADHGEGLGEHGLFVHANSVREELLRIPLVLLYYGVQPHLPERVRDYPSQVDIAPTILRELDLPIPSVWSGQPLQEPRGLEFSFFAEHGFGGLIDHRDPAHVWKYSLYERSGEDHVFELHSDPHENRDLRDVIPPFQLADLRKRMQAETSADLPVH